MNPKDFPDHTLVFLSCGPYEAAAVPDLGAQVISLRKNNVPILHEPRTQADLSTPTSYGLPVLFPPNRIDKGRFMCAGKVYQFPINEPERNNSLHGFLHTRPWTVEESTPTHLVMRFDGNSSTDFYRYLPVTFTVRLCYDLTEEGLFQRIEVQNTDTFPMPLGLGFHSAFALTPDMKIKVSVGQRIELNERALPTGKVRDLAEEKPLREEGLDPTAWDMDDHYTVEPLLLCGRRYHGAVLEDSTRTVYYEVDQFYRHWMIWNCHQDGSFICIEPQNWRINAPNLVAALGSQSGFDVLAPQEKVTAKAHLFCEEK